MLSKKTLIEELKFVEVLFLNAPLEKFDINTLNFFERRDDLTHTIKEGNYTVITENGSKKKYFQHMFSFYKNPAIKFPFDSGLIRLNLIETNKILRVTELDIEIFNKNMQDSRNVFSYIDETLNLDKKSISKNGSTIIYEKKEFKNFTTTRLSFRKTVNVSSAVFYEINLEGF